LLFIITTADINMRASHKRTAENVIKSGCACSLNDTRAMADSLPAGYTEIICNHLRAY